MKDINTDDVLSRRVMKLEKVQNNESQVSQVYIMTEPPTSTHHNYQGSKYDMNNTYIQTNKNDSEVSIVKHNSVGQETFAKK